MDESLFYARLTNLKASMRHPYWTSAAEGVAHRWAEEVYDRLLAACGAEDVEYVQTTGSDITKPVRVDLFTTTRRVRFAGEFRAWNDTTADVIVKGRRGLSQVQVIDVRGLSEAHFPSGITLALDYSDGDALTVGQSQADGARLGTLYSSLLDDLGRP